MFKRLRQLELEGREGEEAVDGEEVCVVADGDGGLEEDRR